MIEVIGTIATVIAICGVVMNNHRMVGCFWLWIVSNAMTAGIHVYFCIWSMAARDVVFLALAVHGLMCWRKSGVKHV